MVVVGKNTKFHRDNEKNLLLSAGNSVLRPGRSVFRERKFENWADIISKLEDMDEQYYKNEGKAADRSLE